MKTSLKIRRMLPSDLPSILKIQSACYTEVEPESYESLLSKLRASPTTCLVAISSGSTVGYLLALPWSRLSPPTLNSDRCVLPRSPDCLYLHDLAVSPSARGRRIGDALFDRFLSTLRHFEFNCATLIAVQRSAGYWNRYGFQEVALDANLRAILRAYGTGAVYMEFVWPPTIFLDAGGRRGI